MSVPIPADSTLPDHFPRVDYSDAYAVTLPPDASTDPGEWADRLFSDPPGALRVLLGARDRLVGAVGLKRAGGQRAKPFPELARTANEVVLGMDDLHLDFRVGVHVVPVTDGVRLTVGTVVRFHNAFGRLYFLPVRPAHKVIVRSMLRRATERRPEGA
jgi:hypothetical protein